MERWRDTEELPGYQVSNIGRIRRKFDKHIMTTSINNGYVRFTVTKHVHRLVAQAFLDVPNDEGQAWVDHIDGNRSNNRVDNLRWVTPSENCLSFGYKQRKKNKQRKVKAVHVDGREIIFESRKACAEYFGTSDSEIIYGKIYQKHSRKNRTDPNAHDKKGWMFTKVEDIV